jgi:outer membrane lipoprotein SlyB
MIISLIVLASLLFTPAWAQRAGQNISVQYGKVTGSKPVDLRSGAVPGGAVVGGALGLASASGKSSSKKARNALIGGIAGGAIASSASGSNQGMLYEVDLGSAGRMQVVTDQREIRVGDCVAVERSGETANLRRMSSGYCEAANQAAVAAVADEALEEAAECAAAKQQLVDATTEQEMDLAARKIGLLCDD